MGQNYRFVCNSCQYSSIVSGGIDGGFIATTNTFVCADCSELFDASIESKEGDEWIKINQEEIECPECKKKNIKIWDGEKRECPRCLSQMNDDKSIIILWD